jgi:hypothetical protein
MSRATKSAPATVQTPATSAPETVAPQKIVTLANATTPKEVLQAMIAIMKSKAQISAEQIERTLVFRVLGNGNLVTRENGQSVMLYNTNATTPALLASAYGMIDADAFLALSVEDAKADAKDILNACSMSFSADPSVAISKNDEIKAKPVYYTSKASGEELLGLNFVGVQRAEVAKKGDTSALDALLASLS